MINDLLGNILQPAIDKDKRLRRLPQEMKDYPPKSIETSIHNSEEALQRLISLATRNSAILKAQYALLEQGGMSQSLYESIPAWMQDSLDEGVFTKEPGPIGFDKVKQVLFEALRIGLDYGPEIEEIEKTSGLRIKYLNDASSLLNQYEKRAGAWGAMHSDDDDVEDFADLINDNVKNPSHYIGRISSYVEKVKDLNSFMNAKKDSLFAKCYLERLIVYQESITELKDALSTLSTRDQTVENNQRVIDAAENTLVLRKEITKLEKDIDKLVVKIATLFSAII